MNCAICAREPIVMCRPYDAFETVRFGYFGDEGVMLCVECNTLWDFGHFGSLAQKLYTLHRGTFRGVNVGVSDMYRLLCVFDVITRRKLN